MKKFTISEVRKQIEELNPNVILLSEEYKNCMTKMDFECVVCGNNWKTRLTDIKQGSGCPECGMEKSIQTGKNRSHTIESIVKVVDEYKPNLKILDEVYSSKSKLANVECKECGYKWELRWSRLFEKKRGHYCPCCNGKIVSDKNRVSVVRPELVKYFKNKEDAYNNSIGTRNKVEIKCPECGTETLMSVSDLTRKPFSCRACSDGISDGEKFVYSFLTQSGLEFETQKRFKWLNNRSYDFYIIKYNKIIEVHGDQHYRQSSMIRKSLEYEKSNDALKKGTALSNGISSYIVLDYSNCDFEKLKLQLIDNFKDIIDIDNIDFSKCYSYCKSSNVILAWDLYNKKYNIQKIANTMKLDRKTIRRYLKIAKEIHSV